MPGYIGYGLTNGEVIYVPIPKNASTAHHGMMKSKGWQNIYFRTDVSPLPGYVVVRDPIDRWYSGAKQYVRNKFPYRTQRINRLDIEELIWEVKNGHHPVYDEHTFRQSDFILSSLHEVILVKMEHAVQWCKDNLGLDLPHVRESANKPNDPDLNPILEGFYAEDVALYNEAQ